MSSYNNICSVLNCPEEIASIILEYCCSIKSAAEKIQKFFEKYNNNGDAFIFHRTEYNNIMDDFKDCCTDQIIRFKIKPSNYIGFHHAFVDWAEKNEIEFVEACLLNKKCDVNFGRTRYNDYTALGLAAYRGHTDMVKLLLRYRANPNITLSGAKPLTWAGRLGHYDVYNILKAL